MYVTLKIVKNGILSLLHKYVIQFYLRTFSSFHKNLIISDLEAEQSCWIYWRLTYGKVFKEPFTSHPQNGFNQQVSRCLFNEEMYEQLLSPNFRGSYLSLCCNKSPENLLSLILIFIFGQAYLDINDVHKDCFWSVFFNSFVCMSLEELIET